LDTLVIRTLGDQGGRKAGRREGRKAGRDEGAEQNRQATEHGDGLQWF
jgi:hypothetical protein